MFILVNKIYQEMVKLLQLVF